MPQLLAILRHVIPRYNSHRSRENDIHKDLDNNNVRHCELVKHVEEIFPYTAADKVMLQSVLTADGRCVDTTDF